MTDVKEEPKQDQEDVSENEEYESGGAWRSSTIRGTRKKPRAQFRQGQYVRVINESSLLFENKCSIAGVTFNEGRWGYDYELRDSNNIRQRGTFSETDLEIF